MKRILKKQKSNLVNALNNIIDNQDIIYFILTTSVSEYYEEFGDTFNIKQSSIIINIQPLNNYNTNSNKVLSHLPELLEINIRHKSHTCEVIDYARKLVNVIVDDIDGVLYRKYNDCVFKNLLEPSLEYIKKLYDNSNIIHKEMPCLQLAIERMFIFAMIQLKQKYCSEQKVVILPDINQLQNIIFNLYSTESIKCAPIEIPIFFEFTENLCWLNSCLLCLIYTPVFVSNLSIGHNTPMTNLFVNIVQEVKKYKNKSVISSKEFRDNFLFISKTCKLLITEDIKKIETFAYFDCNTAFAGIFSQLMVENVQLYERCILSRCKIKVSCTKNHSFSFDNINFDNKECTSLLNLYNFNNDINKKQEIIDEIGKYRLNTYLTLCFIDKCTECKEPYVILNDISFNTPEMFFIYNFHMEYMRTIINVPLKIQVRNFNGININHEYTVSTKSFFKENFNIPYDKCNCNYKNYKLIANIYFINGNHYECQYILNSKLYATNYNQIIEKGVINGYYIETKNSVFSVYQLE